MVVKVLHADIEKKVAVDMDILAGLAQMAEMMPEFRNYRPAAIAAEYQRTMRRELDFGREQRNIQQFAHDFRNDPTVHFPDHLPRLIHPPRADDGAARRDQASPTRSGWPRPALTPTRWPGAGRPSA